MSEVTVIGILIQDIDQAIDSGRGGGRGYYNEARVLDAAKTLTAAQKRQFDNVLAADRKAQDANRESAKQQAKFRKMTGTERGVGSDRKFYLDIKHTKDGWNTFVLRESESAARERVEGKAAERAKRVAKLRDLRSRALAAAASGSDLTPFLEEFGGLK